MVTITCPWCERQEPLAWGATEESEASFTCPDCGTSVQFVDEPTVALDQVA